MKSIRGPLKQFCSFTNAARTFWVTFRSKIGAETKAPTELLVTDDGHKMATLLPRATHLSCLQLADCKSANTVFQMRMSLFFGQNKIYTNKMGKLFKAKVRPVIDVQDVDFR